MLSSVLDFFRSVDPYLYKMLGRDMYMALDGAPTSVYVTAGIALSAAVVIAFQARKRLESADIATAPQSRESAQSGRRASNSDSECTKYSDDFSDIEEDGPSNPGRGNMIRRIKIARQRAINKKIEETLTEAELVKEKMVEAQQLAKIYSLLSEGDSNLTIDDIKGQMSMYKASYGDVGREYADNE